MLPPFVRTLRFRLAAAFFIWTGLFQLGLAIALPLAREVYVRREVERRLDDAIPKLVRLLGEGGITNLPQRVDEFDPERDEYVIEVRDDSQKILASTAPDGLFAPSVLDESHLVHVRRSDTGVDERFHISYAKAVIDGQPLTIYAGLSLAPLDLLHASLVRTLLAAVAIGLIGSAVGGWVVSGSVVNRINRVARAVREVSPTRLDERVKIARTDDEIGHMIADLNTMLERMAVAFRSQERFMSEVSHELKTPLSALLTEAQVLKQMRAAPRYAVPGINTQLAAETRKALEPYERFVLSVEEEMRWLGKLVESFLMLARFGHGKQFLAEAHVPMNDVVLDAVEHSTLYARQHGVKLGLNLYEPTDEQPDAMIRGDAELLRVVADNLIRNAVQFSKKGDTVAVRLQYDPAPIGNSHGTLIFTVKDQGPGVPDEYLDRIFDRFQQAPGKTASRRGSGLGLTISKSIVDLHSGTIDARNDPEGGCTFRVRLPIARASEPAPPPPRATHEPVAV